VKKDKDDKDIFPEPPGGVAQQVSYIGKGILSSISFRFHFQMRTEKTLMLKGFKVAHCVNCKSITKPNADTNTTF